MVDISHLLNRTPTIKRDTETADGQGGFTKSPSTISTTTKGRRRPASGTERLVAGREEADVTHVWYFEFGVDLKIGDVIEDGGTSYEVLHFLPPSIDDYLKVQTQEIQNA